MTNIKIGDQVMFTYLKEAIPSGKGGHVLVDFATNCEEYSGKVVAIRDIVEKPLASETWKRGNVKNHRSHNLVTLELLNGDIKSFYDGRMLAAKKVEESLNDLLSSVVKLASNLATAV